MDLKVIGSEAKKAAAILGLYARPQKDKALLAVADALEKNASKIIHENEIDTREMVSQGMPEPLIDRLLLNEERICGMASSLRKIASLDDPIGEVISMKTLPNGLIVGQRRVPIGVIGIIYESRPNVTSDAFGICFKAGNACILRGGKDAIHSNHAIVSAIQEGLKYSNVPECCVQLITDTSHEVAREMMCLNDYIDVLIPRGSARLIQSVVKNSTVPVIETGSGNCHIYVDKTADVDMAVSIIENAKTQRNGVCNACESLVIHSDVINEAFPKIEECLLRHGVEIRGDERAREVCPQIQSATEEDFYTEYLDAIISVKTVDSFEEAVVHINEHSTGHSESIITKDYENAQKFLAAIDSACVYVNASTRFTDGDEFGFGAEIGISTQKLHARGPMGLKAMTSMKYVIYGDGQIRKS